MTRFRGCVAIAALALLFPPFAPAVHAAPPNLALDAKFCSSLSISGTSGAYTLKCDALQCTTAISVTSAPAGQPIVASLACSGAPVQSYQWSVSGDASCPRPGSTSVSQHIFTATAPAQCTYRVIATAQNGEHGSGIANVSWR